MKILGITYDSSGSTIKDLDIRASKGRSKVALAFARMSSLGCSRDLHINLLLLNMDIRPTLLFGAALWGHHQLSTDLMSHPFQPVYSLLMRPAFQVQTSTMHWICTLMAGQLPV